VVTRTLAGDAVLVAVAALALPVAFRAARKSTAPPTYGEIAAQRVREFLAAGNRKTPAQVLRLLGKPDAVYRDNSRALCWRYTAPYLIEMCCGPKRRAAWIGHSVSPELVRS